MTHILLREAEVRACFVEIRDYKELIVGHRGVVLSAPLFCFRELPERLVSLLRRSSEELRGERHAEIL